ncbi:MAG: hypothetical protein IT349_20585 [Candidatus Eisenbacteria bacterium]|nr:hypothetical protein [Candidatus Eisenbacteria bacterium]
MHPPDAADREVTGSALESWLHWSQSEVSTAWAQASLSAREGWDALKERFAGAAPETGIALPEPSAQLYRLNDHARCGVDGHPVQRPWVDLQANYLPPVRVPGSDLEGVARALTDGGTPLLPGEVVELPGAGAHVFQPGRYATEFAQHFAAAAADPSVWHQLVMPSSLAIFGATIVGATAAKYAFQPEPRARTTVEHSR